MPSTRWIKKIGDITLTQLLAEGCIFVRNIIVARMIGAETLGEFAFLVLCIRLFSMTTDLAVDRYVLQGPGGQLKDALPSVHFILLVRSLLLAMLMLVAGFAQVHDIPFASYAFLAGAALLSGFVHQGYRVKQRAFNFKPALYVEGFTNVTGTLLVLFAAAIAPSLEMVCACLFIQAALQAMLSHLSTEIKYRLQFSWPQLRKIVQFGWPLLLTGVTMFWSMQGERIFLSTILSPTEFAHFSMMFQLALVPVLVVSRIALSYGLPRLAAEKSNAIRFNIALARLQLVTQISGVIFLAGFVVLANFALEAFFGPAFKAEPLVIILVGLSQALRLFRAPKSIAAQALGQTAIPFKANLVRVAATIAAFFSLLVGGDMITILAFACIGEAIAWAVQSAIFNKKNPQFQIGTPIASQLSPQENYQ